MSERDEELEQILNHLRENKIDDLKMRRWQLAVKKEWRFSQRIRSMTKTYWPTVAAFILGIVIGGYAVITTNAASSTAESQIKLSRSATPHYIFAKSE